MAVDSSGNPIKFNLTGGQVHDSQMAPVLIAKLPKGGYTIADRAYDSEPIRSGLREMESTPVIETMILIGISTNVDIW